MIEAGRMRHRVTIERRTETRSPSGAVTETWAPWVKTWAAIEPISSREIIRADQPQMTTTHRVLIRYREGVSSDMRVRSGDRVLEIEGVINRQERGFVIELLCKERQ